MKYTLFNCKHGSFFYSICPYTGNLLQSTKEECFPEKIPEKLEKALRICSNPYLCNYSTKVLENNNVILLNKVIFYHRILTYINNKRFYLTRLFSDLNNPIFKNTEEAFNYIARIPDQVENREKLCLQRSFLALKTSKSFRENGVLFIGASLPTGNMHAWIIEDDKQPDILDREWIMYYPLLAFYY